MATLIVIELVALVFAIHTLSSVRAYVGGEGLWSKAQKDATYQLLKYGRSHDENDYARFLEFMKVPTGDHNALVELGKPNPDMAAARQGFIAGRNHPDDVEGMINLFTRFNTNPYISKAITIWMEADRSVTDFIPIGEELHREINLPQPSQEEIDRILMSIDPVNARITVLEDDFSYTLGEGSRWLENIVLRLLFAIALTVELTGLILAIIVSRNIQKGLNEILQSANAVAKGDFSRKAVIYSGDEIGILAGTVNHMSAELQQSITRIEQAEKVFKELLESAPDAMVILDEQDTIRRVNRQCEMIFGYQREQLLGQPVKMLLSRQFPLSSYEYHKIFVPDRQTGHTSSGIELTCSRRNGEEFPVEISTSVLDTDQGRLVSVSIRDISDRKYIRELESKNQELEQFAYISSHDLQEPINTIIGLIKALEENHKDKLGPEALGYIKYISESSQRMTSLITDLLEYSRIGHSGTMETVDSSEIMQDALKDLKARIDSSMARIDIGPLPRVSGNKLELRLLFQNLLSNAVKFRRKDVQPSISISARNEGALIHFSISDNGIGIDPKHLERVFIIFQRLNSRQEYEGTGIGLAHCKKIVEMHGGTIWVESAPGQGSTFHFTLPKPTGA
jgi:PAS domain S-box-containing protein